MALSSPEEKKALVRRYLDEAWNQGNEGIVDEILTTDFVLHAVHAETADSGGNGRGPESIRRSIALYRQAFPDLQIRPEMMLSDGDTVAVLWKARGTHRGEFRGIAPTNTRVSYTGVNIYRIADDKIAEEWYLGDTLGLWRQLGAVPDSRELVARLKA